MADREMLGARIDPNLKRLVDADPRDNQDIVAAALWDEFGGQRRSAVEKRIEHKDRRIMQIKKEIHDLEEELAAVENERESLQQQLEKMKAESEAYQDDLDDILSAREDGDRGAVIIPETLSDVAEKHGKPPEEVHDDLKQRAVEQERRLRVVDFIPANKKPDTDGWVADVWGDGDA